MGFVTIVGFICLSVSAGFAADEFPNRPVKFLVPFNPGGQSDIAVLLMRPGLEKSLGVNVVQQYRPGGGGAVDWAMLKQEKPNGYMMAVTNLPHIIVQPIMTKDVAYKTEDLAPVYLYAQSPGGVAVRKDDDRFKTLQNLIDYAKATPKKLTIVLLFFSPILAGISLKFGPPEFFWLGVMGLTIIASLSAKSLAKGVLGGLFGVLISTIGLSPARVWFA